MPGNANVERAIWAKAVRIVPICCVYICVSSVLIRFNKYLMDEERFPYAMSLAALHMGTSFLLCSLLYLCKPSAFPGMVASAGKRFDLLKWFIPIGITFAVTLYASNKAYLYANVTFLQFMKEGNVVITFLISCAVGLQVMNRVRLGIIMWIMTFCAVCVQGELHFVWLGLALQLTSEMAGCTRVVLGEFVLGMKLDPLTYTLFVAPTCLVVLLVANVFIWDHDIVVRAMNLWHLLLPNACLAFLLNVLVATIVKEASAVGFILTGVVKDIFLVVVSAFVFAEDVTRQQVAGFSMVLLGIVFWSYKPALLWAEEKVGVSEPDEKLPLVTKCLAK